MSFAVQPRPVPIGRDRLGILGDRFWSGGSIRGDSAQHVIGLDDAYISLRTQINYDSNYASCILWWDSAGTWGLIYQKSNNSFNLWTSVGSTYLAAPDLYGRVVDIDLFWDRDGLAYLYIDGQFSDSASVSASTSTNMSGSLHYIGGRQGTSWAAEFISQARLFVIGSDDFPALAERNAIAAQNFNRPDEEPRALLERPNHDTEKRIDLPIIDVDQDGTTVPNDGTGVDFIIQNVLEFRDVRTVAEGHAIVKPDEDWYAFDAPHNATNGSSLLGCSQGSYITEAVYKNLGFGFLASGYQWRITASAVTEVMEARISSVTSSLIWRMRSNSLYHEDVIFKIGEYSEYARYGLWVSHLIYDADSNEFSVEANGHLLTIPATIVADLDLSGSCNVQFDGGEYGGLLALRIWNAASLPVGWREQIARRVHNPWTVKEGFAGMTLRANYEGRAGAQKPSSLILPNQAQPGAGDLTISGSDTWGESRVLVMEAA
jgi:hypothetical protein